MWAEYQGEVVKLRTLNFRYESVSSVFVLVAALSVFSPNQASAQSSDLGPLVDRMERLERDIRTLNVQLSRGRAPGSTPLVSGPQGGSSASIPSMSIARFEARLSAMEEDIRSATGTVETVAFDMGQVKQRLEKLIGDVDFRLTALENASVSRGGSQQSAPETTAAPSPGSVTQAVPKSFGASNGKLGRISQSELDSFRKARGLPTNGEADQNKTASVQSSQVQTSSLPSVKNGPEGVLPTSTPKEQYDYAFGLLRQAKYEQAEVAFKEFLAKHGDDKLASNAYYWLGETFYVRKNYQPAASVFYQGFKTDPKGSKAAGTLLKLGMSLANLDKKTEACTTFEKLKSDFPAASHRVLQTVNAEWKKNGCK
jgi:tol-pal system protein YbgF